MDFAFTETQEELRTLARRVFSDQVTGDRLKEVDAGREGFDRTLWETLGRTNLLGVALPEDVGGSGEGLVELAVLVEEAAAAVAPVPLVATLILAALPIAEHGNEEQRARLLPGVVAGQSILSAAVAGLDPEAPVPPIEAAPDGGGWRLDGITDLVPVADAATRIVVPARAAGGAVAMFLLDPAAPGVSLEPQRTSGDGAFRVVLDGAVVDAADVLAEPGEGEEVLRWLLDRALAAFCVMQAGYAERAMRMTAEYTSGREQFGRPLATFQAVQQRAADAYIDVEVMRWTAWRAAARLADGLPAAHELAVAKFWAAEGGQRVLSTAQHLHGGIGVDVDYPLHRYLRHGKDVELALGGANRHLAWLGDLIAAEPA